MEVNQKELAAVLGVTDRRIRQLKADFGLFEKNMVAGGKKKIYILEKCVQEYIDYKIDAEMPRGAGFEKEKEQAEHEQIKKKISMLKLRRLRGELHEADDVERFLMGMLLNFRNRLLAIPHKLAPLIVGEDDINIILDVMEKELLQTMEELSGYDPAKIDQDSTWQFAMNEEDEEEQPEKEEG